MSKQGSHLDKENGNSFFLSTVSSCDAIYRFRDEFQHQIEKHVIFLFSIGVKNNG